MELPALTDLEHILLLVLATLGPDAYGVRVRTEVATRTGRDVAIGSVYAALERLEARGLVRSEMGEPTPERGGRAKKFFVLEGAGREALRAYRRVLDELWTDAGGLRDPVGG